MDYLFIMNLAKQVIEIESSRRSDYTKEEKGKTLSRFEVIYEKNLLFGLISA